MKRSCKIWIFFRCHISLLKALGFGIFLDFKCLDKGCSVYKWSLCGPHVVSQSRYMQQLANTGVIRCSIKIQAVGQICWSHGGPTAGLDEGLANAGECRQKALEYTELQAKEQQTIAATHTQCSTWMAWKKGFESSLAICASLTHGTWVCWSTHKSGFICTKVVSRLGW